MGSSPIGVTKIKIDNMKKITFCLLILCSIITLSSCTENQRDRTFGGTATIKVEKGKKVMMATWKGDDLFYMVEDMEENYIPHDKTLIESSNYGVIESKVVFKESR